MVPIGKVGRVTLPDGTKARLPRGSPEQMIKNPGRGYTLRNPADGIAMAPEEAAKPWSN